MTDTMRVAVLKGPGDIEIQSRPVPRLDEGKILVKVSVCGICGSDLGFWRGVVHRRYPYSPGHEFCGTVEKIGANVTGFGLGQRVVIDPNLGCGECSYCRTGKANLCDFLKTRPVKSNGGFGDYVALDARMASVLSGALPDEIAPFIEPLSCALHAVRQVEVKSGDDVMVFGAGTMGLLTALVLKSCGADVFFIEPIETRREQVAALLESRAMTSQQLSESDLAGKVDIAVDCSGRAEAVSQAVAVLRKAGQLVLSGVMTDRHDADGLRLSEIIRKELVIRGAWLNPNTFDDAIRLAVEHKEILQGIKTGIFALDDIEMAFEKASSRDVVKVLVRP